MKAIIFFLFASAGTILGQEASSTAGAPSVPSEKARAIAINQELKDMAQGGDSSDARWSAVDSEIGNYQKQCGVTPQTTNNVVLLRRFELGVAKQSGNEARYDALVQKLATDPLPAVANLVARIADLKTKPIDLKFTSLDGKEIDFAALRGKVVLIDFWATWCGPCVEEVPNVIAAYKKYHGQGFEIVGISLDQDKAALQSFITSNRMVWPQYFDGKGWQNAISSSYGINSIPAMWLVDKHGLVVTMNGRDDLDSQVAKLLGEP